MSLQAAIDTLSHQVWVREHQASALRVAGNNGEERKDNMDRADGINAEVVVLRNAIEILRKENR